MGEPVELELTRREEPLCGLGGRQQRVLGQFRLRRGLWLPVESGQMAGEVAGQQVGLVMGRVVRVHERGGLRGVVVVLIVVDVVLLIVEVGVVGRGLASGRNVGAVEDAEAVDPGLVPDGVGLAVVADVLIGPDAVVALLALLPDDDAVLLVSRVPELGVGQIEPLLLQDFGQTGVALETHLGFAQSAANGQQQKGENLKLAFESCDLFHTQIGTIH